MGKLSRGRAIAVASAAALWPSIARAANDPVIISVGNTISDAPLFIALDKGFYKEFGIEPQGLPITSGAQMMPSLGTGQLEVGGGAPSASLYNAVASGINVRIVADKGSTPPGYGYAPILVRKALVDSGKVKSFSDFRGLNIAEVARGTASLPLLMAALKKGGLTIKDVNEVFLGFPEHVVALTNGAIDASVTTEPQATLAIASGVAVRFASSDSIYPNQELSSILFSQKFTTERRDVAVRYMAAYIKAARYYNDALKGGHYAGPTSADVIDIIIKHTSLKDPALYKQLVPAGLDPNGRVNIPSLKHDLEIFRQAGLIQGNVTVEQTLDESIATDALKLVGPYRPRKA
jgi:NitT/TauT family transport system substrate-binding protein